MITRREVVKIATTGLAIGSLTLKSEIALGREVSVEALSVPGPLGDVVLGSKEAKVTVIEYASLTCLHCAIFHSEIFPEFKKKYIDTGKVRFMLREFPLDDLSLLGFMLARRNGGEKYSAITDLLFKQQGKTWARVGDTQQLDALLKTVRQAGITQEEFDATIKDRALYEGVIAVRDKAMKEFGIDATPVFFINGKKHLGAMGMDELEKIIEPLLAQ